MHMTAIVGKHTLSFLSQPAPQQIMKQGFHFLFGKKNPPPTKPHPFEGVSRKTMQSDVNRFSKQDGSFYSMAVFDFFPFVLLNVDQRLLSTARHLSRGLLTVSLGWPHFLGQGDRKLSC